MGDLLVLWDVDYTLLSAVGLGNRLYGQVFKDMFGRDLAAVSYTHLTLPTTERV